jgi:hypothetical protein
MPLAGMTPPREACRMPFHTIDELRQEARALMEGAREAKTLDDQHRLHEEGLERLRRAGLIEQTWLEMVAGSRAEV